MSNQNIYYPAVNVNVQTGSPGAKTWNILNIS